ncbi:THAP [Nesidiocoris tenuis]|uniref:THAP n=1 Tax=Nesidiocoris tenuis TaxID=355587 RepID=A0ABN7AH88_9HEMI|nr:THAP [Nesidiocoris tenuis]
MVSKCFVPHCKTGYPTQKKRCRELGLPNPSLFSTPLDPGLLEQWSRNIRRADATLNDGSKVCSLHFTSDCIIKEETFICPNGTKLTLQRKQARLKKGAVPTIFPLGVPAVAGISKRRHGEDLSRVSVPRKKKPRTISLSEDEEEDIKKDDPGEVDDEGVEFEDDPLGDADEDSDEEEECACIKVEEETEHLRKIEPEVTPLAKRATRRSSRRNPSMSDLLDRILRTNKDPSITACLLGENLILQKWSPEFSCLYKIVVEKNKEIQTFVRDFPIDSIVRKIERVEDIREVQKYLDTVKLCQPQKRSKSCRGYLLPKEKKQCENCRPQRLQTYGNEKPKKRSSGSRKKPIVRRKEM